MQTSADSVHQEVEHVMSALVDAGASSEERTIPATVKAARYHLAAGGHRVRAKLALHACDALQIKPVDAYRLAACVELLHNASLVHDDLQDEEKTCRGQPTVWAAFGRNVAICTGDLLLSAAHGALSEFSDPTLIPALLRRVHQSTAKVIHGQCDELSSKDRVLTEVSRYEQIVIGKSGALLSLPLELAFLAARKDQWRERVQQAAHAFGVGYQMVDDLDDLAGDEARQNLNIVLVLRGLGHGNAAPDFARQLALQQLDQSIEFAASLPSQSGSLLIEFASVLRQRLSVS